MESRAEHCEAIVTVTGTNDTIKFSEICGPVVRCILKRRRVSLVAVVSDIVDL